MEKIANIFQNNIKNYQLTLKKQKKKQVLFVCLRLLTFFFGVFFIYKFFANNNNLIDIGIATLFLLCYIIIHRQDYKLNERILLITELLNINAFELKFAKGESKMSETGIKYVNTNHLFTHDLDIFGNNSLFQNINRTTTFEGSKKLAFWLSNPLKTEKEIRKRQEAIIELKEMLDWRQLFIAYGKQQNLESKNYPSAALNQEYIATNRFLKIFAFLSPICLVILFTLAYLNLVAYNIPIAFIITNFFVCAFLNYKISKSENSLNLLSKQIHCYYNIAIHIKTKQFTSIYLKEIWQKLFNTNEDFSYELRVLSKILKEYEQRNNLLWQLVANSLFLKDIHILIKFENWQKKNKIKSKDWLNSIAEIDALNSFSNFYFHNQDFCFPTFSDGSIFESKGLSHPLINRELRVANDFNINNLREFFIVTGANMSGKSTFLRTVGVNLVLACSGAPVCAKSLKLKPVSIISSMRTTDNLAENSSYFHAELLRLKDIMEKAKTNEKTIIILDEIMKGTNSKDKHNGTKLFLEKLLAFNVSVIIATHNLELAILENEKPDNFKNICFEVEIANNIMHFDYKIKNGTTQNQNATFLLKKMGVI